MRGTIGYSYADPQSKRAVYRLLITLGAVLIAVGWRPGASLFASDDQTPALRVVTCDRMHALAQALADKWSAGQSSLAVEVRNVASPRAAWNELSAGTADVAAIARVADHDDLRLFRNRRKVDAVGTPIALDNVLVIVHHANPVASISSRQIADLLQARVRNWTALNVALDKIQLHVPPLDSGTGHALSTIVLEGKRFESPREGPYDSVGLAARVASQANGLAFIRGPAPADVRVVPLNLSAEQPPLFPTMENVANGTYPLRHYLYLYTAGIPSGAAKDWIVFALSSPGQEVIGETGGAVRLSFNGSTSLKP